MNKPIRILTTFLMLLHLSGCEKDRLDAQVRELCAKDGGIKVYETVKLPPEKFDKYGVVRIPSKQDAKLEDEYYYEWKVHIYVHSCPKQLMTTGHPEV